jgi:hypothetical protein
VIGSQKIHTVIVIEESLEFYPLVTKLPNNVKLCFPTTVGSLEGKILTKT